MPTSIIEFLNNLSKYNEEDWWLCHSCNSTFIYDYGKSQQKTPKFCPVCGCANDTIVGTDMIKPVYDILYICDPAKNTRCRDKIVCQTVCRHTTDIRFARDFEKILVGNGDYYFVQKELAENSQPITER